MSEMKFQPPLHERIGNMRHTPSPSHDAYTEIIQTVRGKKIPREAYNDDALTGTSDNPRTGKHGDFVDIENISSPNEIAPDSDETNETFRSDTATNDLSNLEDKDKISEAWKKMSPEKDKTISSEQTLTQYVFPAEPELTVLNPEINPIGITEKQPMRPRVSGKYPQAETRAAVRGRSQMSKPPHIPQGFERDLSTTKKQRDQNMQKAARPTKKRVGKKRWTRETISNNN